MEATTPLTNKNILRKQDNESGFKLLADRAVEDVKFLVQSPSHGSFEVYV
jgi:hypothetical protein